MKIFINSRCLNKPMTGVQRYLNSVMKGLEDFQIQSELIQPPSFLSSGLFGYFWEQCMLPFKIPKKALLWSPANIGPIFYTNQVVTAHDLAWLDHPEWFKFQYVQIYKFINPILLKKCRLILTVSEYSKKRMMETFGISEKKIIVTGNYIDEKFKVYDSGRISACLKKYKLTKPYVLSVGSLEPRKNIQRLLEAWSLLPKFHASYDLIVIGSAGVVFKNQGINRSKNYESTLFLGRVSDDDLCFLYAGALLFAYPSLYEGFGFPILEAMASGVPVLSSNITSIPEVAGDAAYLINPYSIDEIAQGLSDLLSNQDLREQYIQKGFKQLELFSREKVMQKFKTAFESVL